MSYTVCPYLLKIDDLKKAVGSRDDALFAAVLKHNADEDGEEWDDDEEENDECVDTDEDDEDDDERMVTKAAIRAIIDGNLQSKTIQPHQYGYALEAICRYMGNQEFVEALESVRGSWTFEEMWPWILGSKSPVSLPDEGDDFPYVGHIRLADIQAELDRTKALDFSDCDEDEQEMYTEIREGLVELYETALEKQMDIVTFYYWFSPAPHIKAHINSKGESYGNVLQFLAFGFPKN